MIQAVIPTTPGRGHLLKATVASLEEHGIEPVVVHDSRSCGEGWEIGLERCTAEIVGLWSDDLTIQAWDEAAVLDRMPTVVCPVILNPNGGLQGAGGMRLVLADGEQARNCICPIAERELFERFRPWPHLNHYCDTWITQRAVWAHHGPVVTWSVRLVHHQLSGWDSVEYAAWQEWLGRP